MQERLRLPSEQPLVTSRRPGSGYPHQYWCGPFRVEREDHATTTQGDDKIGDDNCEPPGDFS